MLFIGVFVVVSYSSISLGVSAFFFPLCNLVFGPQCVFVMSRTCNNVEFDSGLSSKQEVVAVSDIMREEQRKMVFNLS